jgi:hypothetical protein
LAHRVISLRRGNSAAFGLKADTGQEFYEYTTQSNGVRAKIPIYGIAVCHENLSPKLYLRT